MESEVPSTAEKAEYRKQSVIGGIENMNSAETRQDSIELDAPDFINAITELGLRAEMYNHGTDFFRYL